MVFHRLQIEKFIKFYPKTRILNYYPFPTKYLYFSRKQLMKFIVKIYKYNRLSIFYTISFLYCK